METALVATGALSAVASVFGFLSHGWPTGLGFLVLGILAFGLARLFELLEGLLGAVDRLERGSDRNFQPDGAGSASETRHRKGGGKGIPGTEDP